MSKLTGLFLFLGLVFVASYTSSRIQDHPFSPPLTEAAFIANQVSTPTLTPQPSNTPTALPTLTYTPSPVPPTPTPFFLSGRNPTNLDVIRFVFNRRQPDVGTLIGAFYEDLAEERYNSFIRQDVDINGDGKPEILVSGGAFNLYTYAAILANTPDNTWQEMFYTNDIGWYCADARSNVNAVGLVIVDFLTCWGGTGYFNMNWVQRWVQCNKSDCLEVWSAPLLISDRVSNPTISHSYSIAMIEQPDHQTIQLTTHQFEVAGIPYTSGNFPLEIPRRIVGPDIQEIYRWDGNIYQLESEKQLAPGLEIMGEFDVGTRETSSSIDSILSRPFKRDDHTYDNDKFVAARTEFWGISGIDEQNDTIWISANYWPDVVTRDGLTGQMIAGFVSAKNHPICRLTVKRQVSEGFELIGRADVPCTAKFTRLSWVDIDGDNDEELMLLTIPPDSDGFQRLHIYNTDEELSELAVQDGGINGPDGVGIKWENVGDDFRLFIGIPLDKAGCNLYSLSCLTLERLFQVYRWDKESRNFQLVQTP